MPLILVPSSARFLRISPILLYVCAVGNHSRVSADLKQHIHSENFEYLILEMIKLRTRGIENISYNEEHIPCSILVFKAMEFTSILAGLKTKSYL